MTDNKKKTHLIVTGRGGGGSGEQVQADWNQTDDTQVDYIKNKPTIPAAQVNADWNAVSGVAQILNKPTIPPQQWFGTQAEYDLIDPKDPNVIYNIEGSDNVQADWNQSDSSADDYIKNKPTIPAAQVNADWNAVSGVAQILNKPTIPAAQVQSDWNQSDNTQADYIKNKPTISAVPAMETETLTFTLQGGTTKTIEFYTVPNYFYVEDISGSDNTLSIKKDNDTLPTVEIFKSLDCKNWTSMGNTDTTAITATIPANSRLYLKATTTLFGGLNSGTIITASGNHNVGGNIMSLLYGDNYENQTTLTGQGNTFRKLFAYDSHLINANKLQLPATTLVQVCYVEMFLGCSHLITAPATLPATTLTHNCYGGMFKSCSALTTAPEIAATTLATACYELMFNGCTSLTTAPTLLASVLMDGSCYQMFLGCSSLNKVVTYADDISAGSCLSSWLASVSATGDFYNLGSATYTSGASGIPSGWTEHTSL